MEVLPRDENLNSRGLNFSAAGVSVSSSPPVRQLTVDHVPVRAREEQPSDSSPVETNQASGVAAVPEKWPADDAAREQWPPHKKRLQSQPGRVIPPAGGNAAGGNGVHGVIDVRRKHANGIGGKADRRRASEFGSQQAERSGDFAQAGEQDHGFRPRHKRRRDRHKALRSGEVENSGNEVEQRQDEPHRQTEFAVADHFAMPFNLPGAAAFCRPCLKRRSLGKKRGCLCVIRNAVSAGSQSAGSAFNRVPKQVDFGEKSSRSTAEVIFRPHCHGPVFLKILGPEYETR